MPRKADELGPLQVQRLKAPGLHPVGGVAGLRLQVSPSGARSWILRTTVGGKRIEKGLGGYPDVTLAQAREKARKARDLVSEGVNPIEQAKAARSALQAAAAKAWTFDDCIDAFLKDRAAGWTNAKHSAQWLSTLKTYASPHIGSMLVRDIDTTHVLAALRPIWHEKPETATRLRGRIEAVLSWATTSKYREGPNPARWRDNIENILLPRSDMPAAKVIHHPALPYRKVGAFMADLRKVQGQGARALEFAILTAARSGEVRGAKWSEIDSQQAVWTIPAERMKAGKEHRVPLSGAAIKLLKAQPHIKGVDYVFPSSKGEKISDMTLSAVLRRMGVAAVPHGFRSTFRDWCAEQTNFPREVAEAALAHTLKDKTEAAYQRGDYFEKRAGLMKAWADFCGRVQTDATVTLIRARKA
jgi:integrase